MNTKLNRSDYIVLVIIYLVTILLEVYAYVVNGNNLIEFLVDIPSAIFTSLIIIILFMHWLIPQYLINQKPNYFLFAFFGVLILSITGVFDYFLDFWSGDHDWTKFPTGVSLFVQGVFTSSDNVGLDFGLLLAKKFYESQAEVAKVEQQQKENELKLLRSQLDPHFLFNNLNTLDALIDRDGQKAKEYINRLSLIYRYLIQTKDSEIMELSEEMKLAENYIFLIETRFGTDYDFHVSKQTDFSNKFLPTGAIQTLLENVVKHNKPREGEIIRVSIDIEANWLIVTNQKTNLKDNENSLGTGLANLKSRYQLLTDKVPNIIDGDKEYKISIPIIKLSNEI